MTDTKDNSSLPLLFAITGTILAVAVGGWFFLDQEEPTPASSPPLPAVTQSSMTPVGGDEEQLPEETIVMAVAPEAAPAVDVFDAPATGIEAELRKARLAAGADILVLPAAQSAVHYYGLVLDAEPDHEIANAELDAILARVAQSVTGHLAAEEYDRAYEIAVLVARRRPEHELVIETQQTLDTYTEDLVQQAIQLVREGNDDEALLAIATAEGLPGRNPDYFSAVRDSIIEIQDARQAAEAEADRRQRAVNDARNSWVQGVRGAIARGDLISPQGSSARDLLAEPNSWNAERTELGEEYLVALMETSKANIETELLEGVDELIDAAADFGADDGEISQLRASLEGAILAKQSNSIVPLSQLVQTKTASPIYPRRASRTNITGYVDLIFTVTTSGETTDIKVHNAEPETVFDAAAIKAVSAWEFEPVEYRGQVISQRTAARLVFRLE